MSIINFTVEEINLIAIYKADTLAATLATIDEALPDIYDEDIISIAESASCKLAGLTEPEFTALFFIPADETEAELGKTDRQNVTGETTIINITVPATSSEGGGNAKVIKESTD
jgi:hypothetical protein